MTCDHTHISSSDYLEKQRKTHVPVARQGDISNSPSKIAFGLKHVLYCLLNHFCEPDIQHKEKFHKVHRPLQRTGNIF